MRYSPDCYGISTDVGNVRPINEDTAAVCELRSGGTPSAEPMLLAMVADGMGGHAAGEIASATAVETVANTIRSHLSGHELSRSHLIDVTAEAFVEANAAVYAHGNGAAEHGGMGTTLTTALLAGGYLCIGHVGDSRAFLLHHGKLRQLTRDHTLVQQKVDAGLLTPEEARVSEERNQLVRAIGVNPEITADIICLECKKGDALLLCSDGLHGSLTPLEMATAVAAAQHPQEACDLLVSRAKARDGSDNITAVCIAPSRKTPQRRSLLRTLLGLTLGAIVLLCGILFSQYMQAGQIPIPIPRQPQEGEALVDLTITVKKGYLSAKWASRQYPILINGNDLKQAHNHFMAIPGDKAGKYNQHFLFQLLKVKDDYHAIIQRPNDLKLSSNTGIWLNERWSNDVIDTKPDSTYKTFTVLCKKISGRPESIWFYCPGPQAIKVVILLDESKQVIMQTTNHAWGTKRKNLAAPTEQKPRKTDKKENKNKVKNTGTHLDINTADVGITDKSKTDNGTTDKGTTDKGAAATGAAATGTAATGTADKGTANEGGTDTGTTDTGTTDTGTTDKGTADKGTAATGTTDKGTTDKGTANEGTTDTGTTDNNASKP